jgi:hypothetical protein
MYLVLANYGRAEVLLETTETYLSVKEPSVAATTRWSLPPRSLLILKRHVT